ncbi:12004_t:CDS:1, partial [Funneliformis mosseae]
MWSIGYLIRTAHVELQINEPLREYAMELMKVNIVDTPLSAEMAIKFLWQNYREILRHEGLF